MESDLDSFINSFTFRSKVKTKREVPQEEPGQHSKELNPHWKNGGTGLPAADNSSRKSAVSAGDGGLSWWTKALKRCKEMAAEQGKSLEEVAAERYGSLEFLHKKIKETELFLESAGRSSGPSSRKGSGQWKGRSFAKPNDSGERDYHSGRSHRDEGRRGDSRSHERSRGNEKSVTSDTSREDGRSRLQGYAKERGSPPPPPPQDRNSRRQENASRRDDAKKVSREEPEEEDGIEVHHQLSAEERNKLSAKLLRAEMMGDQDLVKQLKSMLDGASHSSSFTAKRKERGGNDDEEDKEILVLRNRDGGVVPFVDGKCSEASRSRKHKLETHRDGKRVKYFHDDDEHKSLETLVREEKLRKGSDDLAAITRMAGRGSRALNEDETIDDEMLRNEAKNRPSKMLSKEKQLAIIEQKKMSYKIDDCPFCFKNMQKHLVVSMGTKALLCVPRQKSMVPGHCLIVPLQHVVQSTACDEDVLEEINAYKKSLVRMFAADDNADVIFMETCKNLKSYPHLVVECIPVPREVGETAPIYFQKAIGECGPEWSNNKKLVKIKGGVKRSIPAGFPYFHVGFGMEDGYGHVIEDEESFPWFFGREIIGGLMDLEPTLWRKPKFDNFEEQRKKVVEFSKDYKPFDPFNAADANDALD